MITCIKGKVFSLEPGVVNVETKSGLIYRVLSPVSAYNVLQGREEVFLYTLLKIKDDDPVLYGFLNSVERFFFEKMTTVSGIGAKTALSFISAFSVDDLSLYIEEGNITKLSSVPGVGKKTAQRMVLELAGKLSFAEQAEPGRTKMRDDLVSALINLGFPAKTSEGAADSVIPAEDNDLDFGLLFKKALKKITG